MSISNTNVNRASDWAGLSLHTCSALGDTSRGIPEVNSNISTWKLFPWAIDNRQTPSTGDVKSLAGNIIWRKIYKVSKGKRNKDRKTYQLIPEMSALFTAESGGRKYCCTPRSVTKHPTCSILTPPAVSRSATWCVWCLPQNLSLKLHKQNTWA